MQCSLHLCGRKRAHTIRWIGTESYFSSLPSQNLSCWAFSDSSRWTQVHDFRYKGWLLRPEGTYPSVASLSSEPWDPEPLTELCNANMCLALQPRRGRTKTEKIQEMVKSVELIRVKQKPLSPGGDSPDLRCTSALSTNTSNGLLVLVFLWCINQFSSDSIQSASLNLRLNRGDKLKVPGGENIFVIFTQKKASILQVTTTKPRML